MKQLAATVLLVGIIAAAFALSSSCAGPRQDQLDASPQRRGHSLLIDYQYALQITADRPVRDFEEQYVLAVEPVEDVSGFIEAGGFIERGIPTEVWLTVDGVSQHPFTETGEGRWEWIYPGNGLFTSGQDCRVQVHFMTSTGTRTLSTGFPRSG